MIKTCFKCKIEKPVTEFNKQNKSRKKDKLDSYCRTCRKELWSSYYAQNKYRIMDEGAQARRSYKLRTRYGITEDQYYEMSMKQNGLCIICEKPEKNGNPLSVDHDHDTGAVRGLLCNRCNVGITKFYEDWKILLRASQYLEDHGKMK